MGEGRTIALWCAVGVLCGALAVWLAPAPLAGEQIEWSSRLDAPLRFELDGTRGRVDASTLRGRWTIVQIGFLHCPDACPTALARLARLVTALNATPAGASVDVVFVSVDPGRDELAALADHVAWFHPAFAGATGRPAELRRFCDALGLRFAVSGDGERYEVAHSEAFTIIGPDGALHGRFRPGFDVDRTARELAARISTGNAG